MSYTYLVPKRKYNRICYRVMGGIFTIIALLQVFTIVKGASKFPMLTGLLAIFLGYYGIHLIYMSVRKQAFDITYKFSEEGLLVTHHYGEKLYTFEDIEFITMVIADPNLIFYVLNIKAGKDIYTIPFTMKKELCETIYEFVHSRIKHKEQDED
ncbi:MAG: hypothetical protein IJX12_07100 [Lachnospiraceae bacterium]|nr:hypothetical protein [Lachnospiraceae bacterium]